MSGSDLEAQATPRIKDALNAAIQRTGVEEFAKISGTKISDLDRILQGEVEYVSVAIITLACQINRSGNDPELARSSISECLTGAIWRLPQQGGDTETTAPPGSSTPRSRRTQFLKGQKRAGRFLEPTAIRVMEVIGSLIMFLVLGYFLGGIVLGPLFGLGSCVGIVASSPLIAPCAGSGLGLVFGSVIGIAYTYYFFVKKL